MPWQVFLLRLETFTPPEAVEAFDLAKIDVRD